MKRLSETINCQGFLFSLRIILGIIFLAAGLSKLAHPGEFVTLVVSYHLLPLHLAQIYGYCLPLLEVITGCLLVIGIFVRLASAISLAMIISFIMATVYALVWGNASGSNSCGCFGDVMPLSHTGSLTLEILMVLMASWLLISRTNPISLEFSWRRFIKLSVPVNVLLTLVLLFTSVPYAGPIDIFASSLEQASSSPYSNSVISNNPITTKAENTGKPQFMFFYADWCHYCQQEKPIIDKLEQQYSGKINFVRISGPDNPQEMDKYGVTGFPTMLLMNSQEDGQQAVNQRFNGLTEKEQLQAGFESLLSKEPHAAGPRSGPQKEAVSPPSRVTSDSGTKPPVRENTLSQQTTPQNTIIPAAVVTNTSQTDATVSITDSGFQPAAVTILPGQGVHWVNNSSVTQTVTAASGLFDSGQLQHGAGFSIALAIPGVYEYSSTNNPGFHSQVRVFLQQLPGTSTDLVENNIPDFAFPPAEQSDYSLHPVLAVQASRTRILLGFKAGTTVGQANTAIQQAGVLVAGGLPNLGMILVQAPDTPDFSGINNALNSLQNNPVVDFAVEDKQVESRVTPLASEFDNPDPDADLNWTWEVVQSPDGGPNGSGRNWGLEASRFPQAWNLKSTILSKNSQVSTGIIDQGFGPHQDLGSLKIMELCQNFMLGASFGKRCTDLGAPAAHGNFVAGVLGATFGNPKPDNPNRSIGVDGANPVAKMYGVPADYAETGLILSDADGWWAFDRMFDAATNATSPDKHIPNLKVINWSQGMKMPELADWNTEWGSKKCGPGENDDTTPAAVLNCTPNNADEWLKEMAGEGKAALKIAAKAAENNIIIVQAGGEASGVYPAASGAGTELLDVKNTTEFAWASLHWNDLNRPDLTNPIIVVEAMNMSLQRYSHGDVDLSNGLKDNGSTASAPGTSILSTSGGLNYRVDTGTSFAAPHVTGLIGYLLAYNPNLSIQQIKDYVIKWSRPNATATDDPAPHIDAFASLMAIPGAALDLTDVNDSSKDGNQRVNSAGADQSLPAAPDGKVDMKDFRVFRDAWLQICQDGDDSGNCPPISDIRLNGSTTNPKKDLNQDGCVNSIPTSTTCPTTENTYPRFDFNGDGKISLTGTYMVPLKTDGSPAAGPSEATSMTDLDVLRSQWLAHPGDSEGYLDSDLPDLMKSGDIEVHADSLFAAGADEVEVTVDNGLQTIPVRILKKTDGFIIITAAAEAPGYSLQISATATAEGHMLVVAPRSVTVHPGEDVRVDLCATTLVLSASPLKLTAGTGGKSTVMAALHFCDATSVRGIPVAFSMNPSGPATISPTLDTTDANGEVSTTFTAGDVAQDYVVTATADLGNGKQVQSDITVSVQPPLYIKYVWEEDPESWTQDGSTNWGTNATAALPDCTYPGVVGYCIQSSHVELATPATSLQRQGTLMGGGSTFFLSETMSGSLNQTNGSWTLTDPNGSNPQPGSGAWSWEPNPTESQKYQNYALNSSVSAQDLPAGISLNGLSTVAELGYHEYLTQTSRTGSTKPVEIGLIDPDLMLAPRGDGTALRYAFNSTQPVLFPRQTGGSFGTYQFCGDFTEDQTTHAGQYYDPSASQWVYDSTNVGRKNTYQPGDLPMPAGPGQLQAKYKFAAVASYDPNVAFPSLPDCSISHPPTANFSFTPDSPGEGRVVQFTDLSTDSLNDIVSWQWTFGDGATDTNQNPWHLYPDNGNYIVKLTVTDSKGSSSNKQTTINVVNLPPEAEVDDVTVPQGSPVTITARIWDPGRIDDQALTWQLTSTNPTFPQVPSGTRAGGPFTVTIPAGLPAGQYPLTLTCTDKDGATATAKATVTVGPTPTSTPLPGYTTCNPNVSLDGQEYAFLDLINAYRTQNGLSPVLGVSPTLTQAAKAHSQDMATHDFFSHTGSDGSTPWQRATQTGYTGKMVGENIYMPSELASDALYSWKSSTEGHNENMLNPAWKAIGIAQVQGANGWYWTTDFGDLLDCPSASYLGGPSSSFMASGLPCCGCGGNSNQEAVAAYTSISGNIPLPEYRTHDILALNPGSPDIFKQTVALNWPPVPAFVISPASPNAKGPVTFINVSHDAAGNPNGASLNLGDGSSPVSLSAGKSYQYSYPTARSITVSLTATDAMGNQLTVNRPVTVRGEAVIAVNDAYNVLSGNALNVPVPGVLGNDTDANGNPLTAVLVTNVKNGALTLNTNGSFTYTPSPGFTGNDSFTYKAYDGQVNSNIATVSIGVFQPAPVTGGTTSIVSINNISHIADNYSYHPSISADGHYVAFDSQGCDMDGCGYDKYNDLVSSVFVVDRQTGTVKRISLPDSSITSGSYNVSEYPSISADGRYIAYESRANNLVPGVDYDDSQIYVYDMQTGKTKLASVAIDSGCGMGMPGCYNSSYPAISADGRYIAFQSDADNLVPNDYNYATDIFVRDLVNNTTTRVSVDSSGNPGNYNYTGNMFSSHPAISADGSYVVFTSTDLLPSSTQYSPCGGYYTACVDHIYRWDRATGKTILVSRNSSNQAGNGSSDNPSISGDGRYIAFQSGATNLGAGSANGAVLIRDMQTGTIAQADVSSGGVQSNNLSFEPAISADGSTVAFGSYADNLVPIDVTVCWNCTQVYIHNLQTGETSLASQSNSGQPGDWSSPDETVEDKLAISSDGSVVSFDSWAGNLVPTYTNGSNIFVRSRTPSVVAPSLKYTGPTQGIAGSQITLKASLTNPGTGAGLPDLLVTFNLQGLTTSAITDSSGNAQSTLALNLAPGIYTLTAQFAAVGTYQAAQATANFTVAVDQPPVANPGGPYMVQKDGSLSLDGSASFDPDSGDMITDYEWDLNNDGIFGDATGAVPAPFSWSQIGSLICGGNCSATQVYPISLRVTDTASVTATASTTVAVNLDFILMVSPPSQAVTPGSTNAFAVSVISMGDFNSPVTLSLRDPPSWLTYKFDPNPVIPSGVSVLTITAAADAPGGTFTLNVVGTGGGITREASSTTRVAFGLIPICYGGFEGTVTDSNTGQPIAGVSITTGSGTATTDATGHYSLPQMALDNTNGPVTYNLEANVTGYWYQNLRATAICGITTEADFKLAQKQSGNVTGTVWEGTPDPNDNTTSRKVTPTTNPIGGAQIITQTATGQRSFSSGADGQYNSGGLDPDYNNAPKGYLLQAMKTGYWPEVNQVTVNADQTTQSDFALVKQCTATITGVFVDQNGGAIVTPNVQVQAYLNSNIAPTAWNTMTNSSGVFGFSVTVDYNNAGATYKLGYTTDTGEKRLVPVYYFQNPNGSWSSTDSGLPVVNCGGSLNVKIPPYVPPPPPVLHVGSLEGYVTDSETGQPISNASVYQAVTDASGYYKANDILAGTQYITASATDYWSASAYVPIIENTTSRQDFSLTLVKYGTAQGTVSDAATQAPLPGAGVAISEIPSLGTTLANVSGQYQILKIAPAYGNYQRSVTLDASMAGYWDQSKSAVIIPGQATTTDFALVKKCTPAKITGIVVNAYTQQPIQGATVSGGEKSTTTDINGLFDLENYEPGYNNSPMQLSVTASASGFLPQTKVVTIFCGASITLDFGRPETAWGTIIGTATVLKIGQPLPGVFIGSGFGASATTDASGNYILNNAPLGANGLNRTWSVTAMFPNMPSQTKDVTATAGQEVRLDFSFDVNTNVQPVAEDQTVTTTENTSASISLNASDPDGDSLTYSVVAQPSHGALSGAAPDLTYTPANGYTGTDSFTFKANDGLYDSNVATVSITVNAMNHPPVANDDSYGTNENTVLNVPASTGVLANDTDADGDNLTAVISGSTGHGNLNLHTDGSFVYTPDQDFSGNDSFTYKAFDGKAYSNIATVTITVSPVNIAPVAVADSYSTNEDTPLNVPTPGVLGNDIHTQSITAIKVTDPSHGTVTLNSDGSFTYTPSTGYVGIDSFTYKDSDGTLVSSPATVTITINATNHAPVAGDQSVTTDENTSKAITLTATDPDGDKLTYSVATGPSHGTLSGTAPDLTYTPNSGFFGTDSFTFKANDGQLDSNIATVSIIINQVNYPPVASDDSYNVNENSNLNIAAPGVLGNDTDAEKESLTANLVNGTVSGSLTLNSDGSFTYAPNNYFFGNDSFTYKACDAAACSNTATVSITINHIDQVPTVLINNNSTQSVQYSDLIADVTITASDIDSYGELLIASTSFTKDGGSQQNGLPAGLSLNATGNTHGGPFPGGPPGSATWTITGKTMVAPGVYVITISASDGNQSSSTGVTIKVTPEDARATYSGALFVSTSSATNTSATVTLRATIQDITAVPGDLAYDPYPGDISNAKVTFVNRDTGTIIASNVPVTLMNSSDTTTGTAAYNWAVDIGNNNSQTYTVGIEMTNYYTRNCSDDDTDITVSKPLSNFITGGGYLVIQNSSGQFAATAGTKMNFGFNVKFNKSLKNLQGQVNVVLRQKENGVLHIYQIKDTAADSLTVNVKTGQATYISKANLTDITNPLSTVTVASGVPLVMSLTDKGEPGNADTIAFTLWDKSGALLFSSNWNGTKAIEQTLGGGNLVIH